MRAGFRTGAGGARRSGWAWTATVGAFIAVVLLAAPGTVAGAPTHAKTWLTPYHGVRQSTVRNRQLGACSTSNVTQVPTFSSRTGRTTADDSTSTISCAGAPAASAFTSFADGSRILTIPVTFTGTHVVLSFNWTVSGNATTSIDVAGSCPNATVPSKGTAYQYCDLSAEAEMDFTWRLLNQSGVILSSSGPNGFIEQAYSSYDRETQCSASTGRCTNYTNTQLGTAAGGNWSGAFTRTFTYDPLPSGLKGQNHHYLVWIQIQSEAYTQFEFYPSQGDVGTIATAALDFSSAGYGARLNSISVS